MMMMQHTNDKRLALQEKALRQLEAWYEGEMDELDAQLMSGDLTQEEYAKETRKLYRAYEEDYADIFAG